MPARHLKVRKKQKPGIVHAILQCNLLLLFLFSDLSTIANNNNTENEGASVAGLQNAKEATIKTKKKKSRTPKSKQLNSKVLYKHYIIFTYRCCEI